ncbi:MAG: hypothetical protein ABJA90_10690 [Ginsengibacter sp.]
MSFRKYNNVVLVMPIDATSSASFLFFLNKKIKTSIEYAGSKKAEEPKNVNARNTFVAIGDSSERIADEIALSKPLSCSNTISSVITTKTISEARNKTIVITIRSVIHFAIVSLNREFSSL